jgi:hypothetical protein
MKLYNLLLAILLAILICFECAAQSCEILFKRLDHLRDSAIILRRPDLEVILINNYRNKLLVNKQEAVKLKRQVLTYETFCLGRFDSTYFIYMFPIYSKQVGPYVTANTQGILVIIDGKKRIKKVYRSLNFYEEEQVCDSVGKYLISTAQKAAK